MKVRHASRPATENVPIRHCRETTDSVPAPKPSTLLVPIPSEMVALAPSALPHIVVEGHTSRWTFALLALPFALAFSLALVLAFAPLIFAIRTISRRLSQVGLKLFRVRTGVLRQRHGCRSMGKANLPVLANSLALMLYLRGCKDSPMELAEFDKVLGDVIGGVCIRNEVLIIPSVDQGERSSPNSP